MSNPYPFPCASCESSREDIEQLTEALLKADEKNARLKRALEGMRRAVQRMNEEIEGRLRELGGDGDG